MNETFQPTGPMTWATKDNIDTIKVADQKKQDLLNIESGRAMEIITARGFDAYRDLLCQTSYGRIAERVTQIADALPDDQLPEWITSKAADDLSHANESSRQRANELSKQLQKSYPKDGEEKFFCSPEHKKIYLNGDDARKEGKSFARRVYIDVPTRNLPEIFAAIAIELKNTDLLSQIEIALNLETFHVDSISGGNSIVIYLHGDKPELMTAVFRAISNAKKKTQDLWKKSNATRKKCANEVVGSYKIPVDDDISFVEVANVHGVSWDSGIVGAIMQRAGYRLSTQERINESKQYSPENPGEYKQDGLISPEFVIGRQRVMPALIMDDHMRES